MKASNVLTSALCLVGSVWLVLSLNGCAEVVDTSSTTSTLTPATTTTSVTGTTTSAWTSVGNGGNGIDNNVQALAIDSAGRLYAGGSAFDAGTNNYLKRLNGSSWEAFGGGIDSYIKVLKIDGSDDLFIGGEFSTGNFPAMPGTKYIAKWGKR